MPASPRALVMPLAAPISAAWPARVLAPPVRQAPTLKKNSDGDRLPVGREIAHERRHGVRRLVDVGDDRRDARLDRLRQADPEVEAERPGDLVLKEGAERLARGAPHHLADRPAEGEAVIAVARAGRPERRLVGQPRRSCSPIRRDRCPSPWRAAPARRPNGRASCAWSRAPCRCWPNSGHSSTTGASRSSLPRLASTWAQSAVAPLVQEKTMLTVSLRPRRAGLRDRRCRPTDRPRSRRRPSGRPRRRPRRWRRNSSGRLRPRARSPACRFPRSSSSSPMPASAA